MAGTDYKALSYATRGCVFRVVSVARERCVCYFGGSALHVFDLAGGHVDTISVGLFGGNDAKRAQALRLLGGDDDRL